MDESWPAKACQDSGFRCAIYFEGWHVGVDCLIYTFNGILNCFYHWLLSLAYLKCYRCHPVILTVNLVFCFWHWYHGMFCGKVFRTYLHLHCINLAYPLRPRSGGTLPVSHLFSWILDQAHLFWVLIAAKVIIIIFNTCRLIGLGHWIINLRTGNCLQCSISSIW